jgi:cation:H+ antiporter
MEVNLSIALGMFSLASVAIVASAVYLTTAADIIAVRMGLGRLWVGSLLLAGATSLPELATGVAAALSGSADLAAGNVFGANTLNVSKLTVMLALLGGTGVLQKLAPQQAWLALSAVALTGLATLFAASKADITLLAVSIPGVVILTAYVIVSSAVRRFSAAIEEKGSNDVAPSHSLRWAWIVFTACAAVILVSGPLLAITADRIADLTGIGASFIGVLALAFVTSLPELTAVFTALRIGSPDLAVATIYGTNAFNIAALGVADLFYSGDSLFADVGMSSISAGLFAVFLTGLATIQLMKWGRLRFPLTVSAPLFFSIYVLGLFVVFRLAP